MATNGIEPTSSILASVKHLLGVHEDILAFDPDILMHINSTLMVLTQIGVGPTRGFIIYGYNETWEDFHGPRIDLSAIPIYVYMRVRLLFDPPQMGYFVTSLKEQVAEMEWRIREQLEILGDDPYYKNDKDKEPDDDHEPEDNGDNGYPQPPDNGDNGYPPPPDNGDTNNGG